MKILTCRPFLFIKVLKKLIVKGQTISIYFTKAKIFVCKKNHLQELCSHANIRKCTVVGKT